MTSDSNEQQAISPALQKFARENNMTVVQFFCRPADPAATTRSLVVASHVVPRVGENLRMDDQHCKVVNVTYVLSSKHKQGEVFHALSAIVVADEDH